MKNLVEVRVNPNGWVGFRFWVISAMALAVATQPSLLRADTLIDDGTLVTISLKNNDLPANDLVYNQNGKNVILSPQQARALKLQNHVDLSKLNPDPTTDIWKVNSTAADESLDQAVAIQSGDSAAFGGELQTSTGFFRLNIMPDSAPGHALTLMFGRTVHTLLLRKELMRRLGYKIPPIKYLSKVTVHFADTATLANMLKVDIPNQTQASSDRWCVASPKLLKFDSKIACIADPSISDINTIRLQDVIAYDATPLIYNLALGAPIDPATNNLQPSGGRLLRAASVAFGLVNVPESFNQLTWYVATVNNQAITFTVPDEAYFNCTLDDALWILRKIATLTRKDFTDIVAGSDLPPPVASLLVEKLIARRNSLMKAFSLKVANISYSDKVSQGSGLVDGKIMQQDWNGFASRFAWGDPDSPLKNLSHYFYSLGESTVMQNLITEFNQKLPGWRTSSDISAETAKLQQQAISNFMQTGQVQAVKFGAWAAPLLNGGVTIGRQIVVGSYLGADNMIQLADDYGFYLNAGIYLGILGLPSNVGVGGTVQGSISYTYTHLKPITDLKQATSEPLKKIYIPGLLKNAAGIFTAVNALNPGGTATQADQDKASAQITTDLDGLKDFIDVGESLIITQSISGQEGAQGTVVDLATPIAPSLTIGVGANQLVMARIHFYRKDFNTIQVFKDQGEVLGGNVGVTAAVGYPYSMPLLVFSASAVNGTATSKIYTVNIDSSIKNNPLIFANAVALSTALKQESTEALDALQKPANISIKFTDLSSSFRFFVWVDRTLKTQGLIGIDMPDGTHGDYISLTDGSQTGWNYQAFVTDLATFIVQKFTKDPNASIVANQADNPGFSFKGSSNTREVEFQTRTTSTALTSPFVDVKYKWQGWEMASADVVKLFDGLDKKYSFKFYSPDFLQDTQKVQLYDIALIIRFYQAAIQNIISHVRANEMGFEIQAEQANGCLGERLVGRDTGPSGDPVICGAIQTFHDAFQVLTSKGKTSLLDRAQAEFAMVANLEQFMDFKSLVALAGGSQNLYMSAEVKGFRVGSETLSQPVDSNAFGKPDPFMPNGVLSFAEDTIGIQDGEFEFQWLRTIL